MNDFFSNFSKPLNTAPIAVSNSLNTQKPEGVEYLGFKANFTSSVARLFFLCLKTKVHIQSHNNSLPDQEGIEVVHL